MNFVISSAATDDSFMLRESALNKGDIIPIDCTCIDYGKLETLTLSGILYVVKMKKNLKYSVMEYCIC